MAKPDFESERAAYEGHIASLNDQITWLRATVESLTGLGQRAAAPPQQAPSMKLYTSEEEEDIQEMLAAGLIDAEDATRALEAVGALSTDIEYPPTR